MVGGWKNDPLPSAEVYAAAIVDDTAPPTVTLTAPANGESLSGPVTLTADADDDQGIVSVTFYAFNRLLGADATPPYEFVWDTTQWPGGSTTVKAQARDRANKTAESSVTVTVVDITPPVVTLTSPTAGELVGDPILLRATATDASSWLSVEFLVDGVVVASDTTADPGFSAAISASRLEPGPHRVTARAWDDLGGTGNSATTPPVTFIVPSEGEQATFDAALQRSRLLGRLFLRLRPAARGSRPAGPGAERTQHPRALVRGRHLWDLPRKLARSTGCASPRSTEVPSHPESRSRSRRRSGRGDPKFSISTTPQTPRIRSGHSCRASRLRTMPSTS